MEKRGMEDEGRRGNIGKGEGKKGGGRKERW